MSKINGHIMEDEWRLPGEPNMVIDIAKVIHLINLRELKPKQVAIQSIAFKDIECIDKTSIRYNSADISFPGIVVKGMFNPFNKPYRLIDGRHRLLKTIEVGELEFSVYILREEDVQPFYHLIT